jgi:hypothetical protein
MAQEPIGHAFPCQTDDPTRIVIPSSGESHHPLRKGHPLAAKVYQQDELSPPNKDALFAANKGELSPVNKVEPERGISLNPSLHKSAQRPWEFAVKPRML